MFINGLSRHVKWFFKLNAKTFSIESGSRMVPDEHYFIDERGNRRLVPKFPSSTLDSDPVARTRRELEMEWQRRVLEASVASE